MAKRKNQKRSNKKYQVNNRRVRANHQYKDTVFRMLYRDKANLLSLYNAVNDRNYTNPEELQIVTLENAIYMGMKNDLAFIMDMNLYLYEHQSTYNPNIPLRNLFYIADEYQRLVVQKSLYSTTIQKIPAPRFIEKRLRKGMTLEEIAEDLDEDIVVIQKLINDNSEAI